MWQPDELANTPQKSKIAPARHIILDGVGFMVEFPVFFRSTFPDC